MEKMVYTFVSLESLLINNEVKSLLKKYDIDEMNTSIYDMNETPVAAAVDDAMNIPFLSDYKAVIIKNPFFLTGQNKSTKVEHNLGSVEMYLKNPSPTTLLIFQCDFEKLDSRKSIVKLMKKETVFKDFTSMKNADKEKFVVEMLKEHNLKLTKDVKEYLIHRLCEYNLQMAQREIEKVALYQMSESELDVFKLDSILTRTLEEDVFKLIDAVINKRQCEALKMYRDLRQKNEAPIKLLMLLVSKYRMLLQIKSVGNIGNNFAIAKEIGANPYAVKYNLALTNKVSLEYLKQKIKMFAKLDYHFKSGQIDQDRFFESLIFT